MLNKLRVLLNYLSTVRPLLRLMWQASPRLFAASLVLTVLTGLVPVVTILATSALLETLVTVTRSSNFDGASTAGFVLPLLLLASASLLGQMFGRLGETVGQLQGTQITNHVQMLIAEKAAEIDLAGFEDPEFHNRMRTVADEAPHRPQLILNELTRTTSMLTTLVSLATVLLFWQVWIVPVIFVASLATLWISVRFGTAFVDLVHQRAETERKRFYLSTLFVSDQSAKEVRLFGLQSFLLGRLRDLLGTMYLQDRRLAFRELAFSLPAGVAMAVVEVTLVAFVALQALRGTISIGQFNLYAQAVVQLGSQLPALMFTIGALHGSNLFAASLFDFLSARSQVEGPRPRSVAHPRTTSVPPHIEFQDVSFEYPGTELTVLENVSFEIRPGETVALVGENGAGKSTLVKLLTGLYEPTGGRILFDGVDINTLDRDDLRAYLGVIFQDYTVYHFSARDNVGLGQVDRIHDRVRMEDAAKRSGLHEVIVSLPDGYDTILGRFWKSGHELSGGQRQLVALARALMRDAPVLILDEPSAALDVYTERRFFRRLLNDRSVDRLRTVVFISHRFITVRHASRILMLDSGRLVAQGTHDELISRQGRYAEMFDMQAVRYDRPRPHDGLGDRPTAQS